MKRIILISLCFAAVNGCAVKPKPVPLESGITLEHIDQSVRPQDSFYDYANGVWLKQTEIPADKSTIGTFYTLRDDVDQKVRQIIEQTAEHAGAKQGSANQKVGDLYSSFVNVEYLNHIGLTPLAPMFKKIDTITNYSELANYFGYATHLQLKTPIALGILEDFKDPTRNAVYFFQSGLGLPNRDYYYDESEKGSKLIEAYFVYLNAMLALTGIENTESVAEKIFDLEKRLAEHQRNPVENRQYDQWDNKYETANLHELMPDFEWTSYLTESKIDAQPSVTVAQPEYFESLNAILQTTELKTWRQYLKLQLMTDSAPLLSENIYQIHFDFYNTALRGQEEPRPRWQRGVALVNQSFGELVGQIYVEEYFPPAYKQRMLELVENLVIAYRESIQEIEWMGEETKAKALAKLAGFLPKIGYPDTWKSYEAVEISPDTLIENVWGATRWNHAYELAKLSKPADRAEWAMNPQTVNAYYHPIQNTINFPAGILQPPFFNMAADDAVNYGAIGMVIGHEIGHGFDDQGSKFGADGTLENWWTDEDRAAFEALTSKLIEQYSAFEPLPGVFVNGELTQGENIGDLAGLSIAYKAWKNALAGSQSPVIDGLTGEQRFFLGAAQVFRGKYRDEALRQRVKTAPHSPARYRVDGVLRNFDAFYEVFGVEEGDALYLPAEERVRIW